MSDVILTLPIQTEEAQLFGRFLNRFMESRSWEAERMAEFSDAPYMMVRSDPGLGEDVKVITFQENSVAAAFSAGWTLARNLGARMKPI
jgi:hypothetical protein